MKPYEKMIARVAMQYGLNPAVVQAVCYVESAYNTYAVRYEPNWKWLLTPGKWATLLKVTTDTETQLQKFSWGLMQVMGSVARELGFTEEFVKLTHPEVGLKYGCLKLRQCLDKHKELPAALAAYNAGNPNSAAGKAYATKVLAQI